MTASDLSGALPPRADLSSAWRPRFGLALGLITVTFLFVAAAPTATWSILLAVGLQAATLLTVVLTARVRALVKTVGAAVAVLTVIAAIVTLLAPDRAGAGTDARGAVFLLGAAMLVLIPPLIIAGVVHDLRARGVTLEAVFGAICVYLLLGFLFAGVYGAVANIESSALFTDGTDGDGQIRLYFSFVTLTTLGYGDFAPATDLVRALASIEALGGQLYLVTVIAVLVGNLGRTALQRRA